MTMRPTASLVVAAALWGAAITGTKYAVRGFGPATLLAVELLFATVVLWVMLLRRGYRPPSSWRLTTALGVLEPGLAYLCQTFGLTRTSAGNGALIAGLEAPLVVALALLVLSERLTARLGVSLIGGLLGVAVLDAGGWMSGAIFGDVLVLLGALSAAGYTIVARRAGATEDGLVLTAHQFAIATALAVLTAVVAETSGVERPPIDVPAAYWLVAAAVGIAGYAVSFLLWNRAVATADLQLTAVVVNLIPLFGLATAVLVLGESLTLFRATGGALVIGSVLLCSRPTDACPGTAIAEASVAPAEPTGYLALGTAHGR
jgi:O-acetylserine/cysteine efflux transporter